MKKYAIGLIFLSILALIGCVVVTTSFEPLETLMRPPKVEGENLSIQLAFEKDVGKNYTLKQPISGSYRSAYTFVDLTCDGENEVIVFYSKSNDLGIVRMNVLDKVDGVWTSVADFESVYNDIQEIAFSDLNRDGRKEIVVGWITLPDSYSKRLSVYEIKTDKDVHIDPVYSGNYSMFKIADVDSDGGDEILSLIQTYLGNSSEHYACVLGYDNGILRKTADHIINKSFSSLAAIHFDKTNKIYIDGYNADGTLATDCIKWNNQSQSFDRYFIGDVSISTHSLRDSNVLCKDINADGILDIPTETHFVYYDKNDNSEHTMNIINWVNYEGDSINTVDQRMIFTQYGFSYSFGDDLFGNVCVENSSEVLTFYSISYENDVPYKDKGLFSITVKSDIDLEAISELSLHYTEISYINGRFYFCRFYDGADEAGITNKEVKSRIIAG